MRHIHIFGISQCQRPLLCLFLVLPAPSWLSWDFRGCRLGCFRHSPPRPAAPPPRPTPQTRPNCQETRNRGRQKSSRLPVRSPCRGAPLAPRPTTYDPLRTAHTLRYRADPPQQLADITGRALTKQLHGPTAFQRPAYAGGSENAPSSSSKPTQLAMCNSSKNYRS
jgi:hypothetical protein